MTKNDMIVLRIKKIRIEKKISQKDVAAKIGLSTNAYGRIENGFTQLTLNNMYAIADSLSINIEEILLNLDNSIMR